MGDFVYRLNFDVFNLGETNEIYHHSYNDHEMLQNVRIYNRVKFWKFENKTTTIEPNVVN
jgi:ribosomal protein S4E